MRCLVAKEESGGFQRVHSGIFFGGSMTPILLALP
jgi:hypothetical protein